MKQKPNTPQKYGHAHRIIPIRHRIWQKVALRWLVILAIGAAFAVLCYVSAPRFHAPRDLQISIGMTVIIYVIIIWKSRLLRHTFSKGFSGKIIDRQARKYTKMPKGIMTRSRMPVLSTECIWTVQTDDGYIEKLTYDTEDIWERYFEIGERVRLYKNAKILVKAHPQKDDENLMCPLCGVMVMEPICKKCGVDFAEKNEE